MKDAQLAIACAVLAILGIISLIFLAKTMEPQKVVLSDLSADYVGRLVQVSGTISSVSTTASVTTVKLCSSQCVDVVLFKSLRDKLPFLSLAAGQRLNVKGVVSEYKGTLEITPLEENGVDVE
jgi:DNA/RNA endonuclease YhcR with UshA esterase domain